MRKEGRRGKEGDGREMSQKKRGKMRHSRTFLSVLEVFTRQPVSSPSEAHTHSPPPSAQGCDQQPASPNDSLSLKTSLLPCPQMKGPWSGPGTVSCRLEEMLVSNFIFFKRRYKYIYVKSIDPIPPLPPPPPTTKTCSEMLLHRHLPIGNVS